MPSVVPRQGSTGALLVATPAGSHVGAPPRSLLAPPAPGPLAAAPGAHAQVVRSGPARSASLGAIARRRLGTNEWLVAPSATQGLYVLPQSPSRQQLGGQQAVQAVVAQPAMPQHGAQQLPSARVVGSWCQPVICAASAASSAALGAFVAAAPEGHSARSSIEAKFRDVVEDQVLQLAMTLDQAFERRLHALERRLLAIEAGADRRTSVAAEVGSEVGGMVAAVLADARAQVDSALAERLEAAQRDIDGAISRGIKGFRGAVARHQEQVHAALAERLEAAQRDIDGAISRGLKDFRGAVARQQEEELELLEERMREEYHRAQGLLQQIQTQLANMKPFVGVVQRVEVQQDTLQEAIGYLQVISQRMLSQVRGDRRGDGGGSASDSPEHEAAMAALRLAASPRAASLERGDGESPSRLGAGGSSSGSAWEGSPKHHLYEASDPEALHPPSFGGSGAWSAERPLPAPHGAVYRGGRFGQT